MPSTKIITTEEIQEAELNPVPEFYTNLTGSPINAILEGKDVFNSFIRLHHYFDFEYNIDAGGEFTIEYEHGIKGIPIIILEEDGKELPLYYPGAGYVSGARINEKTFQVYIQWFGGATPYSLKFRAYIYEFFTR